ncbi:MAG: hypothetical protein KBS56_02695 [Clostridiales bacterium]|nr:hypothetical protein [Candidatus Crickella equi]
MALSINQILVICLIAELVVFLVVLARLAIGALGFLKNLKVTLGHTQNLVDFSTNAVAECKATVQDTADALVENATTVNKAICIVAAVLAVVNYNQIVRKFTPLGQGKVGAVLDKIEKRKTKKEIKKTKKEVAALRKAARKEAKQSRKASKMARKLRNK